VQGACRTLALIVLATHALTLPLPRLLVLHEEGSPAEDDTPSDFSEYGCTIAWRRGTYLWGTALLIFGLFVQVYGICKEWNNPPWRTENGGTVHPALEVAFMFFMMTWVALLEGSQISIVGLQGVNLEQYKYTHPRA
jgi:hypothetical protein